MVFPPIVTESSSRSSHEQSTQLGVFQSQLPVTSILLPHHHQHHHNQNQHYHQQQQQPILYQPYNTIQSLTPSNQSQCIYTSLRRNPTSPASLRSQDSSRGVKNNKWRSRSFRMKEHQSNSNLQHPVPYAPSVPPPPPPPPPPPLPPPLILFDPLQSHLSTAPPAPITSIYLNQSSTLFNHGGIYTNENYTNFNPNVITQPYYKPPEMQNYCLIDRTSSQNIFSHQQTIPAASTYYNPTSNIASNIQGGKSFIASTPNLYSSSINSESRIIPTAVGPTQIFPNPLTCHGINYPTDKIISNTVKISNDELSKDKYSGKLFSTRDDKSVDIRSSCGVIKSQEDEKFLDESSNFDFTIEAEKMVSALCNTTSCELDRDEDEIGAGKNDEKKLVGDYDKEIFVEKITQAYKPWCLNDFPTEVKSSGTSIGTQTTDSIIDKSQNPELIRKTIYWGCNEADKILKNSTISSRQNWLQNLSSATKIALTKSSTYFPIFSGDKIFSQDLISALLRVGNGWLILDHYLNKKHYPNLRDKYDNDLIESFRKWQISTDNLLENIIKTFIKLENNNCFNIENISGNSSFPGDVSLYVNYGLFGDPSMIAFSQSIESKSSTNVGHKPTHTIDENCSEPRNRWLTKKENKLRTKWTITEHSKSLNEISKKNRDDKTSWNLPLTQVPLLINTNQPQQKLHYNFFPIQNDVNLNNSKQSINLISNLKAESFPVDGNQQFWTPCIASNSLYNFTHNNSNLNNSGNKVTVLSQIETEKVDGNDSNAVNLSAWFANMRDKRSPNEENNSTTWLTSTPSVAPTKFRESKNLGTSMSRMDANRQLRTLRNMRTIQCAPWTAHHLLDDHQNCKYTPEEYDSSEDVRVYMKPGSYNVPKKKNPSRRSQRREALSGRANRQIAQPALINDETLYPSDSLVVTRTNISSSSSLTSFQDTQSKNSAWEAACASAGLLLNVLKAKEKSQCTEKDTIVGSVIKKSENLIKVWKQSEDSETEIGKINFDSLKSDSSSAKLMSPHQKNSVKTGSWLIKTLSNVSNDANKSDKQTEDSENSVKILPWKKISSTEKKSEKESFSLQTSHSVAVMTLVDAGSKATYSETVRRFSSTSKPNSSSVPKIIQKKNNEREKVENNSLGTIDEAKNEGTGESLKPESDKIKPDKMVKLKKGKNSGDDRDWSVWYSSKKKQHGNNSLGQSVLSKLENIYRTLWRMDVTRLLKYPLSNVKLNVTDNSSAIELKNYEHCRKIVKGPISLETIACKLKNIEYKKVEHAIRDLRKIIQNSKLYHKNDRDCMERVESLSRKLEELLQQYFPDEFSHGRNSSPLQNRYIISSNNSNINNSSPTSTTIRNTEK